MLKTLTDRPWKRVLLAIAALFFLWIVVPWFLDAPPMNVSPAGVPFIEND